MTGSGPYPDTGDDTAVGRGRGSIPGTPRWVKVSGIIALVVVLLIAGLMLFGGGNHGLGRHLGGDTPPASAGGRTPPSSDTEDPTPSGGELGGHAPPAGGHP